MVDTVFIHLSETPDGPVHWLRRTGESALDRGSGALRETAALCAGARVVVLVPTAQVLLLEAKVPTRNRARMMQALPYALEERVAAEVEQLHFAAGRGSDAGVPVAVVAKSRMQTWLQWLDDAGIEPDALVPDVLALPWEAQAWSVLVDAESCLVRTGLQSGWAAEAGNVQLLLNAALAGAPPPERLRLLVTARAHAPELQTADIACAQETISDDLLGFLAAHYQSAHALNLLQGDYGRADDRVDMLRRWRWVAALAGVLITVYLITLGVESARLEQQVKSASGQIERMFRDDFPDTKRIVNAKAQMQQRLDELRARAQRGPDANSFLSLVAIAGDTLQGRAQVQLRSVRYHNRELILELAAQDFQSLDDLKQALLVKGLNVEIDSASAEENNVAGRLRLSGGAS